MANIYWDGRPYVPGQNLERMLRDAAALKRRGKDTQRGCIATADRFPLLYDGPTDLAPLFADRSHIFRRTVVVQRNRVVRVRPIFREWGLKFGFEVEDEIFSRKDIADILYDAGRFIGLCNFRPKFGRFEVVS